MISTHSVYSSTLRQKKKKHLKYWTQPRTWEQISFPPCFPPLHQRLPNRLDLWRLSRHRPFDPTPGEYDVWTDRQHADLDQQLDGAAHGSRSPRMYCLPPVHWNMKSLSMESFCVLHLRAYLAALPTNPPECSHRFWSRNGREGCSGMLLDVITQMVYITCQLHRGTHVHSVAPWDFWVHIIYTRNMDMNGMN